MMYMMNVDSVEGSKVLVDSVLHVVDNDQHNKKRHGQNVVFAHPFFW